MHKMTTLNYQGNAILAVQKGGSVWLPLTQIVDALGYEHVQGLHNLFKRNEDEFGADETALMMVVTEEGQREMRVFSLRGARLLALLSKTPQAKAFRRWALDLMEGRVRSRNLQKPMTLLATEAKRALEFAIHLIEPEHPAQKELQAVYSGDIALPEAESMVHWVDAWLEASEMHRHAQAEFSRIKSLAAWEGYNEDDIRAAVKRRKRLAPAQDQLALDGGANA